MRQYSPGDFRAPGVSPERDDGELGAADDTTVFYASATALPDSCERRRRRSRRSPVPAADGGRDRQPGGTAAGLVLTLFEDRNANGAYDQAPTPSSVK
jgi:hypothetical protein